MMLEDYLPHAINTGPWITAYTLNELIARSDSTFALPICSIATPYPECAKLGGLILPPLFHEAMNPTLRDAMVQRIVECFPVYHAPAENRKRLRVVELPRVELPPVASPRILAFSVDTAVEEHGPHLPLSTDTLQSYAVLHELAANNDGLRLGRPLEYGQLTWGLPFGFSVDLTAELVAEYVAGYVNVVTRWIQPQAVYVVDVHGSITHRQAIVDGLAQSDQRNWSFRWLHEPLVEFASDRGDQHAGGVETALVERIDPRLVDDRWWPDRLDEIAATQMSFAQAVELTPDLPAFERYVREHRMNGVVGDIRNYRSLDSDELFRRMLSVAQYDVDQLITGQASRTAGGDHW